MQQHRHDILEKALLALVLLAAAVPAIAGAPAPVTAAQQDVIEAYRAKAEEQFGPDKTGDSYAGLINFAANPDISTATYRLANKEGGDPKIDIYRVPLRHTFKADDEGRRVFVEATLTHQTYDTTTAVGPGERIDNTWRTDGGTLGGGLEYPVFTNLALIASAHAGLLRLESDAGYFGTEASTILKPVFDGIVFNWQADAWLVGASCWADYHRVFADLDVHLITGLSHNYIETYDASSDLIQVNSQATTFDVDLETVNPLGFSICRCPMALVLDVGNTTLLGDAGNSLGFDYFFEAGAALEANIADYKWPVQKLRLGAKVIYGEDLTGWTFICGYRF